MRRRAVPNHLSTRKKMYTVVLAFLMMVGLLAALSVFLNVAQSRVEERLYVSVPDTLGVVVRAQNRYRMGDLDEDGRHDYAVSLAELAQVRCITKRLGSGELRGYSYRILNGTEQEWSASATPAQVSTAAVFFYADQTGIIRGERGQPASSSSEIYWHPTQGKRWPHPEPSPTLSEEER